MLNLTDYPVDSDVLDSDRVDSDPVYSDPVYSDMVRQIIAGGERAFLASGYDLATMDQIAREAGVARGSVYNHFSGKEELFLAVMRRGNQAFVERAKGYDDKTQAPLDRIIRVATGFLREAIAPGSLEMYRIIVAYAPRFPELGKAFHALGTSGIAAELRALAILAGPAIIKCPDAFATNLVNILMGGVFSRHLLGVMDTAANSIEDHVRSVMADLIGAVAPGDCDDRGENADASGDGWRPGRAI